MAMSKKCFFHGAAAIFFFAAVIYAVGAATRAAVPGMIFDSIRRELDFSAAQTAAIASFGVFGCMAFIGAAGVMIDRFGWRRIILFGVFFQVFGEYLLYSGSVPEWIYAGAFVNGGGRTVGYLALLKFLDSEFDRRYFSVLIGVFYVFSYGGTLLGTAPFEFAAAAYPWRDLLRWSNYLTVACGAAIALLLFRKRETSAAPDRSSVKKFPWREMFMQLRKKQCLAVFYCTGSTLAVYWSIIGVAGKKYLIDVAGVSGAPLAAMNSIVMIEMIFGGTVSYLCGNRRKIFQVAGAAAVFLGVAVLFGGTFAGGEWIAAAAWGGFCLVGAGYGFTCVNIVACREFVPPVFAASAIGFVNFCANVVMIGMVQAGGTLFDMFSAGGMRVAPAGYRILFAVYVALTVPAVVAAVCLRDTRGRNISAEI